MRRSVWMMCCAAMVAAACRPGYQLPLDPCFLVRCSDHGRCAQLGDAPVCV